MAGTGNFVLDKGYRTTVPLSKFQAVKFGAPNSVGEPTVVPVAAATDHPLGVVQYAVASADIPNGKGAVVRILGISRMVADMAIPVGSNVGIDAVGQATVATASTRIIGICTYAAVNPGDYASVLLTQIGPLGP